MQYIQYWNILMNDMRRNTLNRPKISLTANILKIIAIVTMLFDHIGAAVLEKSPDYINAAYPLFTAIENGTANSVQLADYILRMTGRIAFPIFCFLIVQGFIHTRSVKKYVLRLSIFAVISELPFNLAFYGNLFNPLHQNVYLTLVIGLLVIWGLDYIDKQASLNKILQVILRIAIIFAGIMIATILKTDYDAIGVLLIVILYEFNKNRLLQCIIGALSFIWEPSSAIAFILIYFYNGEKGKQLNKYFFYAFYPAHILILYFIAQLIF